MKKYFKIVIIFIIIYFAISAIFLLNGLRTFIDYFKTLNLTFLGYAIFIGYLFFGPAFGLLFIYVGSLDKENISDSKSFKSVRPNNETTTFSNYQDSMALFQQHSGSTEEKINAILNSHRKVFDKIDQLKILYDNKEIDKDRYDNLVEKVKLNASIDD